MNLDIDNLTKSEKIKYLRNLANEIENEEIILTSKDIQIKDCRLLSITEAEKCSKNTLKYDWWWWLRSPGDCPDIVTATDVNSDGLIHSDGYSVDSDDDYVRPALFCTLKSKDANILEEGDIIKINGFEFIYLHSGIFLLNGDIGECAFRKDYEALNADNYEKSDVKKLVDKWFNQNFSNFNSIRESYGRTRIRKIR